MARHRLEPPLPSLGVGQLRVCPEVQPRGLRMVPLGHTLSSVLHTPPLPGASDAPGSGAWDRTRAARRPLSTGGSTGPCRVVSPCPEKAPASAAQGTTSGDQAPSAKSENNARLEGTGRSVALHSIAAAWVRSPVSPNAHTNGARTAPKDSALNRPAGGSLVPNVSVHVGKRLRGAELPSATEGDCYDYTAFGHLERPCSVAVASHVGGVTVLFVTTTPSSAQTPLRGLRTALRWRR